MQYKRRGLTERGARNTAGVAQSKGCQFDVPAHGLCIAALASWQALSQHPTCHWDKVCRQQTCVKKRGSGRWLSWHVCSGILAHTPNGSVGYG